MSENPVKKLSYFEALSEEDRAEFASDLVNRKLSNIDLANKWTVKTGRPITSMSIGRYKKKPEFAIALGRAARKASLADQFDKAVSKGVEPALRDIGSRAREVYDLAKGDPKRNYKAMTDSLAILLDMAKLDAEVQGLIGGGARQESAASPTTLNLNQMIILPRTGPLQVEGKPQPQQIEGHVEDAEWVPVEEDLRLLEDEDEDVDAEDS